VRQAGPRSANLGITGPAGVDPSAGGKSAVRSFLPESLRSVYAIVMAIWLRMLTVVGLLLGTTDCQMPITRCWMQHFTSHPLMLLSAIAGGTTAARSTVGAVGRSLLQQQSAMCGSQGYIIGQSYCVSIRKLPPPLRPA